MMSRSLTTLLRASPTPEPAHADDQGESWRAVPRAFRSSSDALPAPWEAIFGPLRIPNLEDSLCVGQVGQSLDGRVATNTGRCDCINGPAGLAHLHRLRALVDAVIVGIGSVVTDDPQLTVRRVSGPSPARVVIDPSGRIAPTARMLADDGVRRIVVTGQSARCALPGVEILALPSANGHIAPQAIRDGLAKMGLRRLLVEGGPDTLSRFLSAGCLDRLHVIVAPIIIGHGRSGFPLGPIDRLDDALRPPMRVHPLDGEVLFDCDLAA